jgi:hypothetical protein
MHGRHAVMTGLNARVNATVFCMETIHVEMLVKATPRFEI